MFLEFAYRLPRRQSIEQFPNCFLQHWMPGLGCNFGKRLEDEASLRHGGVRNREIGRVHDRVTSEQNVDIDCARAFFLDALTAHRFLDAEYVCHQLRGSFGAF